MREVFRVMVLHSAVLRALLVLTVVAAAAIALSTPDAVLAGGLDSFGP